MITDTSSAITRLHFYFNLSQLIGTDEHIIEAEFHIYKLRSEAKNVERREDPKHNLLEVIKNSKTSQYKSYLFSNKISENSFDPKLDFLSRIRSDVLIEF